MTLGKKANNIAHARIIIVRFDNSVSYLLLITIQYCYILFCAKMIFRGDEQVGGVNICAGNNDE